MIIETGLLSEDSRRFRGEEDSSFLELDRDMFFRSAEPVRYDLLARAVSSELVVTGSIAVRLSCRCARCDEWSLSNIRVNDFSRSYKISAGNETVDLTDDMREDILLALPINFICASSCSGLCPRCGTNLNTGKCSCAEQDRLNEWNALDRLDLGT